MDWFSRRCTFTFATGEHDYCVWWKHGAAEGTQVVTVFEVDGRAWISPDGNWNCDALPIHPPTTYTEACEKLNHLAIAPLLRYTLLEEAPVYQFSIWPASNQDPYQDWELSERKTHSKSP